MSGVVSASHHKTKYLQIILTRSSTYSKVLIHDMKIGLGVILISRLASYFHDKLKTKPQFIIVGVGEREF